MENNEQASNLKKTSDQIKADSNIESCNPALRINRAWVLAMIFIGSLLMEIMFVAISPSLPIPQRRVPDFTEYYGPVAQNIMDGKGFIAPSGQVVMRFPPGYPVILSALFTLANGIGIEHLQLLLIFNILTMSLTALVFYLICEFLFGARCGIIAVLFWITYPFNLLLVQYPYSETPFILLLYTALWLFIYGLEKKESLMLASSGVVFGLAALIRPVGILLGLVAAVFVLFAKQSPLMKRILWSILLITGFLCSITPWEYYVYAVHGQIIPLSTGGPPSMIDGFTFAIKPALEGTQTAISNDVMTLMQRLAQKWNAEPNTGLTESLLLEFSKDPTAFLKLLILKTHRSWYGTDSMRVEKLTLLIQAFYLMFGTLGIWQAFTHNKKHVLILSFLIAVVCYFWAMTIAVLSILRYMIPAMGIIILFGAVFFETLLFRQKHPAAVHAK